MDGERSIESDQDITLDPVCGDAVDLDLASEHDLRLEFEGRDYAFCGPVCRARFAHEPTTYATAGRSEP